MNAPARPSSTGRFFIALCAAVVLHACGGSGKTANGAAQNALPLIEAPAVTATPASSANGPSKPVAVNLTYVLPATAIARQHALRSVDVLDKSHRSLQYISPSNTLLSITVTPLGGTPVVYGPSACTVAACAVAFSTTPGPNTIAFSLTDGSSNVLSRFSTLTIIQPAAATTLRFSANPIVNSVSLSLASPSVNAGTAVNDLLSVNALDAGGNTMVGTDAYVDVNGNPVSFIFNVTNNQAGGRGSVSITGPPRVTAPGQSPIYARYDGRWLASSTISMAASTSSIAAASTTLTTVPYVTEYTVGANPFGIAVGADGNLWFTEYGAEKIGKISTAGTNFAEYSCTSGAGPDWITQGPDGKMWFTEYNGDYISSVTTAGFIQRIAASPGHPVVIALGPDGNLWYSNEFSQIIGRVSPNGSGQTFPTSGRPRAMGFGPDSNIWYLDVINNFLVRMNMRGSILSKTSVPTLRNIGDPDGLITGSDGMIWFVNYGSDLVERATLAGVVTPINLQSGARPRSLSNGPDGNIWVTEESKGSIARVSTSGTVLNEYGTINGIDATSIPRGITTGPDGNIWYTDFNRNRVVKFVL